MSRLVLTRAIRSGEHLSIALPLPDPEFACVLTVATNGNVEQRDSSSMTTVRRFSIWGRCILILHKIKGSLPSTNSETPERPITRNHGAATGDAGQRRSETPTAISAWD